MTEYLDLFTDAYEESFSYALDNRLILNWYPERILKLTQGQSSLELGLGHGYSALRFAQKFARHVVIEGSTEIIKQFKGKYSDSNVEIIHSLFEDFDTSEKFDTIIMGFILEHVDDPGMILEKYRQYLKPGGSLFVTVPNCQALNKRLGYEAGLLKSLWELGAGDIALGHKQLFSVESLTQLVESQGYQVDTTEGILLKPITTQQMFELKLSEEILQAMLKVGIDYPELCVGILMKLGIQEGD